jgi:hypothetical protein
MELKGAKCDDISSLKVFGDYCHVVAFEFGDFNQKHHGWKAEFGFGAYATKDLLARGAKDNDISSMIVERRGGPGGGQGNSTYGGRGRSGSMGGYNGTGVGGNGTGHAGAGAGGWPGFPGMHGSAGALSVVSLALASILF